LGLGLAGLSRPWQAVIEKITFKIKAGAERE